MPAGSSLKKHAFNFYHYEKEQDNHIVLVKEARPTFTVIVKDGCNTCTQVLAFFRGDHHDDGPVVKEVAFRKSQHSEHHEVIYKGHVLALDLAESNKKSSLQWRLKKEFEVSGPAVIPLAHQAHFVQLVRDQWDWQVHNEPFWLNWMMGTGKTLGMVMALFHHPPPQGVVYIAAPKTILQYWAKVIQHVALQHPCRIRFLLLGFTELMRLCTENENLLKGQVVVVDEVQQYRNLQPNMVFMIHCLRRAHAVFNLTGTLLQLHPSEVEYIFHFMGKEDLYDATRTTPKDLQAILQDRVFTYDPKIHDQAVALARFPKEEIRIERVPMTWPQAFEYLRAAKQKLDFGPYRLESSSRNSYDSLTRRICNQSQEERAKKTQKSGTPSRTSSASSSGEDQVENTSPKFERILQVVMEASTTKAFPIVIYSHYKELGVEGLQRRLKRLAPHLRVGIITGSVRGRQEVMDRYNCGELDVLLITNAAHQGCDLLRSRMMIIVDAHVSRYDEQQTKNRVSRFGSHDGVPDPCVLFLKFLACFPTQPPDATTRALLQKQFEDRFLRGAKADFDVAKELMKQCKGAETADECYERKMEEYYQVLLPWVKAIAAASIPFRIASSLSTSSSPASSSLASSSPASSAPVGASSSEGVAGKTARNRAGKVARPRSTTNTAEVVVLEDF